METNNPRIETDCRVLVELVEASGQVEQRKFTIVNSDKADFKSGLLDENAPLGRALLGHFAGQAIPYRLGDLREVRILKVERLGESAPAEAAEKRRAAVRKAEAQTEITDQMIFAGASGSKWGDYDVDMEKLLSDDEKKEEGKERTSPDRDP
ncbi:MAG TPA: GreA/GreB family elongation factor [Anaerolineales bacterium]|nr:GreA/GreB family elongation factor [Anaerolineales bacterium]